MVQALRRVLRRMFRRAPTPAPPSDRRAVIERIVGTAVQDPALYERALTHRSVSRGRPDSHLYSNERLEFLGDAVLGFVTAEHLYHHFPDRDEGFLTRLRAKLVNGQSLARLARQIDLGSVIRMSDNMAQGGGRNNPSILADAFEALIGALYLDLGPAAARAFIHRVMLDQVDLDALARQRDNFKSLLLEYVQAHGWPQPRYRVTDEEGPSHERIFTVEVLLGDRPYGYGTAGSKKKAEQEAAGMALERLRAEERAGT
ncbi:ribonuclease III [Rhodocaloribacter litoris]|nr:ribonuclease III [Rhodocaloribacter litoris]